MWMNLKNVMLSERSQTQKATECMILFIGNIKNRQIHRDKVDWWLSGDGGWWNGAGGEG